MRVQKWQIQLAGTLVLLTVSFYGLRWWLFPRPDFHNEMWRFLIGDIAFLFLQVLLVTMFIDRVAQRREKDEMRQKLNMIVGAFFSHTGTKLLGRIATADTALPEVRDDLVPSMTWKPEDYARASGAFRTHEPQVDLSACDLAALRELLGNQKDYLLGLLGNQSLLEHEQFTDLLWAVTHLAEELEARPDLGALSDADARHIAIDVKRAYGLLGAMYLAYLSHLQANYPYLFSLAVRTNPLDPEAHPEITE